MFGGVFSWSNVLYERVYPGGDLWVKFCMLFLMWSMRQNEYLADEFAYKIGFGLELATVLDQHISDVPHDGFLSAIYSTHPCNDDRVAALQNLGVPYSRY